MTKILVIGLDGATLDLIEPWAQQGLLPNLARLMKTGVYGRLQSVLPVLSSAAWSSFMTGVNPGKHGLYDFVKRAPNLYQLRPVSRANLLSPTLWGLLSKEGRKVGVFNVPMTYPPEVINGVMVTGLGTPDYKTFTYPAELSQVLTERGYAVNRKVGFKEGNEASYIEETFDLTDRITSSAIWLMADQSWDFFMVVYRDPDEMAHFFWHHMDETHPKHPVDSKYKAAMLDYYQKVDRSIGELIEKSGSGTNVMIMSDHGTGAFYKDVYLNEWLRQKGWLTLLDSKRVGGRGRALLAQLGITRSNVSNVLRKLKMGRVEVWLKDLLGDRIEFFPKTSFTQFPDAIDWSQTKAYSFGYHGQIYINLKGREPQGIVEPGEQYEVVCQQIHQQLLELTDPEDHKPVVDKVFHRKEAFWGQAVEDAPDLVVIMRELSYITRSGYEFSGASGQVVAEPSQHQTGSHRMEGVWMLAGPDVQAAGYAGNQVGIIDLAPTALHLLGCAVPGYMDGRVLEQWLTVQGDIRRTQDGDAAETGILQADDSTAEDDEKMIQRLKELGYLE